MDEYRGKIVAFAETECNRITLDEYIIDLAVMPQSDRVYIIEVRFGPVEHTHAHARPYASRSHETTPQPTTP